MAVSPTRRRPRSPRRPPAPRAGCWAACRRRRAFSRFSAGPGTALPRRPSAARSSRDRCCNASALPSARRCRVARQSRRMAPIPTSAATPWRSSSRCGPTIDGPSDVGGLRTVRRSPRRRRTAERRTRADRPDEPGEDVGPVRHALLVQSRGRSERPDEAGYEGVPTRSVTGRVDMSGIGDIYDGSDPGSSTSTSGSGTRRPRASGTPTTAPTSA
jgi:hypothetical protein